MDEAQKPRKIGSFIHDPNILPSTQPLPRPRLSGVVEPNQKDILLCTYPDTMDGFAAAWVIRKIAKRDDIPVEFQATANPLPSAREILGRNWVCICDGSIPVGTFGKGIMTFARIAAKPYPPIPYREWKRTLPYGIEQMTQFGKSCGVHDSKKSLCRLVWEFFCADRVGFDKPPRIIAHIDDHTTESWRYNDTKAICAAISTYAHDFKIYDALATAADDKRRREAMIAAGQGIERYIEQLKRGA